MNIIKNNNYTYSLEINTLNIEMNEVFLNSIVNTNLLNGIKRCSFPIWSKFPVKIEFYASSVKSLSLLLSECRNGNEIGSDFIICMLECLITQFKYIEKYNYSFYSLSLDDIYVIDDLTFLCFNPKWMKPIDKNRNISFISPFEKNDLCSPELLSINKIPSSVNIKTFYYTLGILSTMVLSVENNDDIEYKLNTIYKTKLYWFIKRNLDLNFQNRNLLLI
jgi:hypothetical protein